MSENGATVEPAADEARSHKAGRKRWKIVVCKIVRVYIEAKQ